MTSTLNPFIGPMAKCGVVACARVRRRRLQSHGALHVININKRKTKEEIGRAIYTRGCLANRGFARPFSAHKIVACLRTPVQIQWEDI